MDGQKKTAYNFKIDLDFSIVIIYKKKESILEKETLFALHLIFVSSIFKFAVFLLYVLTTVITVHYA